MFVRASWVDLVKSLRCLKLLSQVMVTCKVKACRLCVNACFASFWPIVQTDPVKPAAVNARLKPGPQGEKVLKPCCSLLVWTVNLHSFCAELSLPPRHKPPTTPTPPPHTHSEQQWWVTCLRLESNILKILDFFRLLVMVFYCPFVHRMQTSLLLRFRCI